MRIWRQFRTLPGGLAASSATLALAYGLIFAQSLRSAFSVGAEEIPHWQFYVFTAANAIVPLVGGIVALWRGSSTSLIAAWSFVAGVMFADVLKNLELIRAAGEPFGNGQMFSTVMATFPVSVAALGLVLVASSRLLSRRSIRQMKA